MTATTRRPKPSRETLKQVLDFLVTNPVLSAATRSIGMSEGVIFLWAKRSRDDAGDPNSQFSLRWPDDDASAAPIMFHDALVLARRMWIVNAEARLRSDCDLGRERVLRDPAGNVIWEKDSALLAQWGGDTPQAKIDAEGLGGVYDYPYQHRTNAANQLERVPAIEHVMAAAALRVHLARSLMDGWNPSSNVEQNTRVSGGVMILKATRQGDAPPPAYSRAAMASPPMSPLQEDLIKRLEDLRRDGPKNPRPSSPVTVLGRGGEKPSKDDGLG
jgi:hypothetical protein